LTSRCGDDIEGDSEVTLVSEEEEEVPNRPVSSLDDAIKGVSLVQKYSPQIGLPLSKKFPKRFMG
jgi:hypothetical protein